MSWTLKVRDKFSAAHYIKEYKGKCEKVHGHTFQVEVEIAVRELDRTGIGFDFTEVKRVLAATLARPYPPQRGLPLQSVGGEHRPPPLRRTQENVPGQVGDGLGVRGCVGHLL